MFCKHASELASKEMAIHESAEYKDATIIESVYYKYITLDSGSHLNLRGTISERAAQCLPFTLCLGFLTEPES